MKMKVSCNRLIVYSLTVILSPLFTVSHLQLGKTTASTIFLHSPHQISDHCKIDKIYQLGDSMADTGNLIRESPKGALSKCASLPYGQDFPHHPHPTGRCSNGLLMIDYIASAAGLPLLNPYKNVNASFTHGVNFAVAGSTALSSHFLEAINFTSSPSTNSSLDVQLHWMLRHFNSICQHNYTADCAEKLRHTLFFVGEIGGNDYNFAYDSGKSFRELKSIVPEVVQAIENTARSVITLGGVQLVIPGDFPAGCFPRYLAKYQTDNTFAYDDNHCYKDRNVLSEYHNHLIQEAIKELKQEFPSVTIIYGDYYNAFLWLLQNARELGFDEESTQKACCGVGGKYNYDSSKICGNPEATVCNDPDVRISWDGTHLTQASYMNIAHWLLTTIIPHLHCPASISPVPVK